VFWGTFSRAKYADARLRISISIACTRLARRSSTSSLRSLLVSPSRRPASTSSTAIHRLRHDSLIPRSAAMFATGWSPDRAKSTARRRNSGGLAAGIERTPLQDDHRLRIGVRESGSGSFAPRAPPGSSPAAPTSSSFKNASDTEASPPPSNTPPHRRRDRTQRLRPYGSANAARASRSLGSVRHPHVHAPTPLAGVAAWVVVPSQRRVAGLVRELSAAHDALIHVPWTRRR